MQELKTKVLKDLKKKLKKFFTTKSQYYKHLYKITKTEYDFFYSLINPMHLNKAKGEIREFQLKTIDFCKNIFNILEKENLKYFAVGGTLIGTIRHQGFIPWDDDIDIGMMRKDYTSFQKYCEKNFIVIDTSKINFSTNNRSEIWAKYLKKYPNQILYSRTPHHIQLIYGTTLNDCTGIDIFCHDYYREDYTMEEHKKYLKSVREKMLSLNDYQSAVEFLQNEIDNNPNIVEKSSKIYYSIDNLDSYCATHTKWFDTKEIFPLTEAKFEDINILIPKNPEYYIENLYPNFKKMPEEINIMEHYEKRINYNSSMLSSSLLRKFKNIIIKYFKQKIYKSRIKEDFPIRNTMYKRLIKYIEKIGTTNRYYELYRKTIKNLYFIKDIACINYLKPATGDIRNYQLNLVVFAQEIIDIIESLGLKYFITSGTLIGAVRHQGFIPWDDDIDICMERKDYEIFKKYCKQHYKSIDNSQFYNSLGNRYPLINEELKNNPNQIFYAYSHYYIQLFKGNCLENSVNFDIFPMEYYDAEYSIESYVNDIKRIKENIELLDNHKKIRDYIEKEILTNKHITEDSNKIYYGFDNFMSYFIHTHTYWLEKSDIFPLKKVKFENHLWYAPNNIDKYLNIQHKNYNTLPSDIKPAPMYMKYKEISRKQF